MKHAGERLRVDPNSNIRFGLLQLGDGLTTYRIVIRNLSERGLTAEGPFKLPTGCKVRVLLRNNGWAEGLVSSGGEGRAEIEFVGPVESSGDAGVLVRPGPMPD
jgi:hypothetical protein